MSLREALATAPVDPRRRCGVNEWIITLDADEQDAAAELLASDRPTTVVFEDFRAEGFTLQENTVRKHRRGACSCVSR